MTIFEYLGQATAERSVDLDTLATTLARHAPDANEIAMNSLQRIIEKGRQEGLERGRTLGLEQGRVQAQREMLLKVLRADFGELAPADAARIEQADAATLERYLDRALTADSLAAVFGS